jgi:cobalamin biosynthesis protein CobT
MDKADPTFLSKLKAVKSTKDVCEVSDYFADFFSEEALEKLMPSKGGGKAGKGPPSAGAIDKAMEDYKDMEDRVAEAIHKEIERCVIDDKEMIYWTDRFDKKYNKHDIVREVAGRTRHDAIDVSRFEDETKQVSNYLMKDLRRLLEERRRRYYVGGYKSGKINARTLWSVKVGNDRIFKKKNEIRDVNAAVSLLIDLSGSMSGTKVHVAMQSAYAFAMVLHQLKIPYEVYGFTTENTDPKMQTAYEKFADGKDKAALDRIVNQNCPERVYAFKEFHENFDIYSKQAMTGAGGSRVNLIQNEDSKHVQLALQRLAARPERMKSLFVFSDGVPAYCSKNPRASYDNLKYYGHNAKEKYGVDVYSIGIQSNSVQNFYKNYKVVQNIQELPNALFEFLRKVI